jgi:hypothetical protein
MLEANEIMIIAFCSFSSLGLLFSCYLMCKHKIDENREIQILQELKNNRVRPMEINYKLEYPQEETKDEHEEILLNINNV